MIEEKIQTATDKFRSHRDQIVIIQDCNREAYKVANSLNFCDYKRLNFISQIIADYVLYNIKQALKSIEDSLENESFSVAEALSRVSCEYSVNLLYILQSNSKDRSQSFMKQYVESEIKKSINWLNEAKDQSDITAEKYAGEQLSLFSTYQQMLNNNSSWKNLPKWPNKIFDRFKALGLSMTYRTIYSSGSDSVHSLSQDIFNLYLANHPALQQHGNRHILIKEEKASFAIYLSIWASLFFCQSIIMLAQVISDVENQHKAESIAKELQKLISIHENELNELNGLTIRSS